jgi:GT2 family glycosyltransferase
MFGEDIDISWRAAKAGWSTWFERDSVFVHLGNSTGFVDGERMRLASTATRRVIEDELPPLKATMSLAALSAGHAARAVAFRVVGNRRSASCARIAAKAYLPLVDPR